VSDSADIGRAAILIATPEVLAELLHLPPGCQIDAAWTPLDQPGVLHLRVRGAGWPMKTGWRLGVSSGTISRGEDGSRVVLWGLPE
jgi:hypothetical protein